MFQEYCGVLLVFQEYCGVSPVFQDYRGVYVAGVPWGAAGPAVPQRGADAARLRELLRAAGGGRSGSGADGARQGPAPHLPVRLADGELAAAPHELSGVPNGPGAAPHEVGMFGINWI